jgi:hypothetical protein
MEADWKQRHAIPRQPAPKRMQLAERCLLSALAEGTRQAAKSRRRRGNQVSNRLVGPKL